MNPQNITFHPAFAQAVKATVEIEEERMKLQRVLEPRTFERVRDIIEEQDARKRAAFYGTIYDAACSGEDFSSAKTIQDIGDIYARFIIRRAFGK